MELVSKLCALIAISSYAYAVHWEDAGDVRWSLNCDFFGSDLADERTPGEQCGPACERRGDCTHFTWTTHNGGTCWLKRGGTNEGAARDKHDEGAVCGYMKSRVGGGPSPSGGDCVSTGDRNCIKVINRCNFPLFVGVFGRPSTPNNGGFRLDPNGERNVHVESHWEGRIWGRTNCFEHGGRCSTGDCGGQKAECEGRTGEPPATLAEIKFRGAGQDYYDVSNVDGYNLPMKFGPIQGTASEGAHGYRCAEANCMNDAILHECPGNLAVRDNGGRVVGCKSECAAHNNPEYCCNPPFNSPQSCRASDYANKVKAKCPLAYSYAYDDNKSTFTCNGNGAPSPAYYVQFCG